MARTVSRRGNSGRWARAGVARSLGIARKVCQRSWRCRACRCSSARIRTSSRASGVKSWCCRSRPRPAPGLAGPDGSRVDARDPGGQPARKKSGLSRSRFRHAFARTWRHANAPLEPRVVLSLSAGRFPGSTSPHSAIKLPRQRPTRNCFVFCTAKTRRVPWQPRGGSQLALSARGAPALTPRLSAVFVGGSSP